MSHHPDLARRRALKGFGLAALSAALLPKTYPGLVALAQAGETKNGGQHGMPWVPGLQLYTLGLTPHDDLPAALKQVAAMGYREVELPGHYDHPVDQLRRAIDGSGMSCPSVHVSPRPAAGMWDLSGDIAALAGNVRALGARYAVVPIPLLPDRIYDVLQHPPAGFDIRAASRLFESLQADDWKRTADMLNDKAAALAKCGVRLAYHNHGVDFYPLPDGTNGFAMLIERTEPSLVDFELDVGWAVTANQRLPLLFDTLGQRLRLLHLKDTKSVGVSVMDLASTDLGTGIIDWTELVKLVHRSPVEHVFVEQEPPFAKTPMDSARADYQFMSTLSVVGRRSSARTVK